MKIISLKSLNINSLKGTTEINFEELTKKSALFSITGPTGSGKSTILDIISCALYGQTARLKNPNDLMSKYCGEAYCEVELEIKGKRYRSSWTQKRARKKHDGKFQTAKMEIVDLQEEKVLPLKSREVPKKIEELSGLDFARFTQSMLLAQGSFDAFLKADEKERSILLEKITGTQIYADISMAIFDKHRAFEQEIESEQKVLASIELMNAAFLQEKQKQLAENIVSKQKADRELKEFAMALHWLEQLSRLQSENKKFENEFVEVTKQKEENKTSFEKLAVDKRALNIFSTFTSHKQLQENITSDKEVLANLEKELATLKDEIQNKDKEYIGIKKEFAKQAKHFELETKKLKEAREIKTQEHALEKNQIKEKENLQTSEKERTQVQEVLSKIVKRYRQTQKQLDTQKDSLHKNRKDEKLLSSLGVIEQNIDEYKKEKSELDKNRSKLENFQHILLSKETECNGKKKEVDKLSKEFQEQDNTYASLLQKTQNETKLEVDTQSGLVDVQTLMRAYESYTKLLKSKDAQEQERKKNADIRNALVETKQVSHQHLNELKKHIETLREKLDQEQRIKKYEEDRKRLVDGEACMLCGSTNHPYATDLEEIYVDKTKEMIVYQERELEGKEQSVKELELRLNSLNTKLETSELEIKKLDEETETLKGIFRKHSFEVKSDSGLELQEKEEELLQKLESIKKNRRNKDALLKRRESVQKLLQEHEKSFVELKSLVEKAMHEKEQISIAIKSNNSKIDEYEKSLELQLKEFSIQFRFEDVETQLQGLQSRKEFYISTVKKVQELEFELHKLNIDKKENEMKLIAVTEKVENLKSVIEELEFNLKNLSTRRVEILNVADLDSYEEDILTRYKASQAKEQNVKNMLRELTVKHEERETSKKSLDRKILEAIKKFTTLSNELEELYKQNGFHNAEEFQNAMLEKTQRDELEILCKTIDDRLQQIQTLKEATNKKLQIHQKEAMTKKTVEELEVLQSLLKQKTDALQESIGSDKKELELNEENSDKFKKQIASLEEKKESFKVWVKLNELVGSADGTKFKKFAQGITLDQLISLANQHLNILSSRYTLVRNQNKLLELEVVDAYQGDAVRPVSTLSGGESFIASLALALGLSELASQKIKIDSLFLDEGFGTLDGESLETALNALNLLQSGGKMVGVISHVEALKERIPLQIKIIPNGDGTSSIDICH